MELSLLDFFSKENIVLDLESTDKVSCITTLVDLADKSGKILDKDEFLRSLLDREDNGTTGIGKGIAIPHARTNTVKDITISLAISRKGVDYHALDKKPVHIIFLIAAPVSQSTKILILIAKICRFFNSTKFREELLEAKTKDDVINLFKNKD